MKKLLTGLILAFRLTACGEDDKQDADIEDDDSSEGAQVCENKPHATVVLARADIMDVRPSGDKIVYSVLSETESISSIHSMQMDGSNPQELYRTDKPRLIPTIYTDATHVYFVDSDQGTPGLYKVAVAGGKSSLLTPQSFIGKSEAGATRIVAVDDQALYVVLGIETPSSKLYRVNKGDGAVTKLFEQGMIDAASVHLMGEVVWFKAAVDGPFDAHTYHVNTDGKQPAVKLEYACKGLRFLATPQGLYCSGPTLTHTSLEGKSEEKISMPSTAPFLSVVYPWTYINDHLYFERQVNADQEVQSYWGRLSNEGKVDVIGCMKEGLFNQAVENPTPLGDKHFVWLSRGVVDGEETTQVWVLPIAEE